jgi:hypothetical protein
MFRLGRLRLRLRSSAFCAPIARRWILADFQAIVVIGAPGRSRSFRYSSIARMISFLTFSIVTSSRRWITDPVNFELLLQGCLNFTSTFRPETAAPLSQRSPNAERQAPIRSKSCQSAGQIPREPGCA